ncbi:hypothetical protein [Pedobacter endophyticus]|uniref:Uncharacterized protein n=1 Tax=Pedobacter endophyticus TaxID=2789740 RepID=A0A7S9L128_9SPHI|nr:hypothetical protein [Pedobacter endophyticus]QPH40512.1 hypothetical protein IZT61_04310 [Pedobacter endophyticus]
MYNIRVFNPGAMELYHGSLGLIGDKINIQSGKGVGWNRLTLGDAFYTSLSEDAACLFSHLVLQKSRLMGEEAFGNLGFAKIYKISLNADFSILDADKALDASRVRSILLRAGVSKNYLNYRQDDQITEFNKAADLLCYGTDWEGNRNEYLTKELGFDGLLIKESAWENWDYYPSDIGVNWQSIGKGIEWPPKSLAIYTTAKISGFELFRDGTLVSSNLNNNIVDRQVSR